MSGAWPKVLIDRCEINLPYVGELWSTLTALFIVVAGIVPLCTSKYSDEEIDLVNALIVLNGITSALAHSTLLGVFGAADGLSINIGAALYVKAIVLAHHPQIYNSPVQCVLQHLANSQHYLNPYSNFRAIPERPLDMSSSKLDLHAPNPPVRRRAILNLFVAAVVLFTVSWNTCTVASSAGVIDMSIIMLMPCAVLGLFSMLTLAYGNATWHLGSLKRTFLRGTAAYTLGAICWFAEEQGALHCPAIISLHSIWHLTSAYALLSWTAFLKYHRGAFFGFRVELEGRWWCPYAVWYDPSRPDENPMIRHSRPLQARAATGAQRIMRRRNTYLEPKFQAPKVKRGVSSAWRGMSICRASTLGRFGTDEDHLGADSEETAISSVAANPEQPSSRPSADDGFRANKQAPSSPAGQWYETKPFMLGSRCVESVVV